MSNNSEGHIWITSQKQCGGWVPPCLASPRCANHMFWLKLKQKGNTGTWKGFLTLLRQLTVYTDRVMAERGHMKELGMLVYFLHHLFCFLLISSPSRWEPKARGSLDFLPHSPLYMMHLTAKHCIVVIYAAFGAYQEVKIIRDGRNVVLVSYCDIVISVKLI